MTLSQSDPRHRGYLWRPSSSLKNRGILRAPHHKLQCFVLVLLVPGCLVEEAHYDTLSHSKLPHPFGSLFVLPASIAPEKRPGRRFDVANISYAVPMLE